MRSLIIGLVAILITSLAAHAIEWKRLDSQHLSVFYPADYETQARLAIVELETAWPRITKWIGNDPGRMAVVLEDTGQIPNGYLTLFPLKIGLHVSEPIDTSFMPQGRNFLRTLAVHELIHSVHITDRSGFNKGMSLPLGNLAYPNVFSPGWWTEGLAVYGESQVSENEGRLNDPDIDSYFASIFQNGQEKSLAEITVPGSGYRSGSAPYWYGGKFMEYLIDRYGDERLAEFHKKYGERRDYFLSWILPSMSFDKVAVEVYGKHFPELYEEWVEYSKSALDDMSWAGERIPPDSDYKYRLYEHEGSLWMSHAYLQKPKPYFLYTQKYLSRWDSDTETWEKIMRFSYPIDERPFQIQNNSLYILHPDIDRAYHSIYGDGYQGYSIWRRYDLETGESETLMEGGINAVYAVSESEWVYAVSEHWLNESEIYHHENGEDVLLGTVPVRISELQKWNGKWVIIGQKENQPTALYYLDLKTLSLNPIVEYDASVHSLHTSKDALYFTMIYNQRSHIFRWDGKKLNRISDGNYARSGRPVNGELFYLADAGTEVELRKSKPKVSAARPPRLQAQDYPSINDFTMTPASPANDYSSLFNMPLRYPLLWGMDLLGYIQYQIAYMDGWEFGLTTYYADPWVLAYQANAAGSQISASIFHILSNSPGLNQMKSQFIYDLDDESVIMGLGMGYHYLDYMGDIGLFWQPDAEGYSASGTHEHFLGPLGWRLSMSGTKHMDMAHYLRGVGLETEDRSSGTFYSLDLLLPLGKDPLITSWSPSFRLDSLYLGAFSEGSTVHDKTGYGAYLKFPMYVSIENGKVELELGVASYENADLEHYFSLEIESVF